MLILELGNTIRQRRKILKITQAHLAALAGVNVNTVIRIERGQINPTLEIMNAIADVLGMEVSIRVKQLGK